MFDLQSEVQRLQQLKYDKVYGLPYKRQLKTPKTDHMDGVLYEVSSQQEGVAISKGFKNKSVDFGRRLSKTKGQKHYPGGGYAGHTIKGG